MLPRRCRQDIMERGRKGGKPESPWRKGDVPSKLLGSTAGWRPDKADSNGCGAVCGTMSEPTDAQMIEAAAAFDAFTRRHKLADVSGSEKPFNELDKQVLLFVADNRGCGPSDIARFLAVASTTISSATDRLVKRGLLGRDRIEGDRRAISLRLSGQGETTVVALRKAHQGLLRMMLQRLSPGEREQFIKLITKIVYNED